VPSKVNSFIFFTAHREPALRATPLAKILAARFPTFWKWMCDQKRRQPGQQQPESKRRRPAYAAFPLRMQRAESAFMLGKVAMRLMKHHPEIRFLTIHDSILTTAAHIQKVRDIMAESSTMEPVSDRR